MLKDEIQQIVAAIPDIRWLRLVSLDGLPHPAFRYEAEAYIDFEEQYRGEDVISAMTAAMASLSERIASEMKLGENRYTVIAGDDATQFMILVGDREWAVSMCISGQPDIDAVIGYFKDRDYLAQIVPLL